MLCDVGPMHGWRTTHSEQLVNTLELPTRLCGLLYNNMLIRKEGNKERRECGRKSVKLERNTEGERRDIKEKQPEVFSAGLL